MQDYLRKIIVSANLLQRKYLPEHVNEKFNPEKIYEKILNLVNKLNSQNFNLKVENRELRRKYGIGPNTSIATENQDQNELKMKNN